jgi:sugar phosphate isomerase/epimerase
MTPAIFSRTYPLTTAEATFAAVKADGFGAVQFNLSNLGLPPLPETAPTGLEAVRDQAAAAGVVISALSGTWNMAHPDAAYRAQMRERFELVLQAATTLGAPIVTLCTGSRDAGNMWAHHPQNTSPAAWADMAEELSHALDRAAFYGLRLGIEPEPANVVCDAPAARRILDQLQAPHLGIVLDAANLIAPEQAVHQQAILDHALDLLGADLLLAHAKDHDAAGRVVAPGDGIINLPAFVAGLRQAGYTGPLIGHGFDPAQAPHAARVLHDLCAQ